MIVPAILILAVRDQDWNLLIIIYQKSVQKLSTDECYPDSVMDGSV